MALLNLSFIGAVGLLAAVFCAWKIGITIHRIFFHPLKAFPGPWICKVSYFYEFYYDLWLPGQFSWKLKELHEKYGMNKPTVHS